jgi:D-xylose transport system substrate-binding protein
MNTRIKGAALLLSVAALIGAGCSKKTTATTAAAESAAASEAAPASEAMAGTEAMAGSEAMTGSDAMAKDSAPAGTDAMVKETGAAAAGAGGKRACIILPDAESSGRWELGDRPALNDAVTAAGFEADIQNAQGDVAKYATIGDQQLTKGCGVMILVDHKGAAAGVRDKAKAAGVPVIAYDRPIEGGSDYYVSFNNTKVGELEGQTVLDGLKAAGKDPKTASVIFGYGDPADGNAKMFKDGAVAVLTAAGVKPAAEMTGTWDGEKAGTYFEQAYTAVQGNVDAVLAPNDNNAASIITILDKNGKTAAVSGQDASIAGLQNVLLGKQTATVYKPFKVEAKVASDLAIALLKGEKQEAPGGLKLADGTPFFASEPILVGADKVKDVVAAGDAKAAELCTDAVKAACEKYGVK